MAFKKTGRQEGFTIVEAALTLAIAGLIFLMMFVALPALQRQARDTERQKDINHLLSELKDYQTNNRGALPGLPETGDDNIIIGYNENASPITWAGFYRDYLGDSFTDPVGGNYKLYVLECNGVTAGGQCGDNVVDVMELFKTTVFGESNERIIYIIEQAVCAGNESVGVVVSKNIRRVAALYEMEGGGVYCENT